MRKSLCVIGGDGIGPEVTTAAVRVLTAVMPDLSIIEAPAGWEVFQQTGDSVPAETLDALQECGAGLFGAVSSPAKKVAGYKSAILKIRQQLNLHANIRPVFGRWADTPRDDVNFVIVRENTEGLYVQRERMENDVAIAERVISEPASRRIGATAVDVARAYRFRHINVVHKANVLPLSDGLFRDSVFDAAHKKTAEDSNSIVLDQSLVDIAAFRIANAPEEFEVIVTTNMFGDILSDLAAHWCGGMGRAPSLNLGEHIAVAEPVHGSAPDIARLGLADPTATILSAALLCRLYWHDNQAAELIESAVLAAHELRAPNSPMQTERFVDQVVDCLDAKHTLRSAT